MKKVSFIIFSLLVSFAFSPLPNTNNIVGKYDFSGNSNDTSGNNFNGELSVFDHTYSYKATGTRVTLYPSIEYPIRNLGWEVIPKLGIKHRTYSLSGNSNSSITDTTPILSVRGKMIFDKMQTKNILQSLEPEMFFLYVPA